MSMKKKHLFSANTILMAVLTFLFTSCMIGDDEKEPEKVEDPLTQSEEYYIAGKILDSSGSALEGVTVGLSDGTSGKTDMTGLFSLKLATKGTYKLTFDKSGYLKLLTDVTIPSQAPNRSSINVSLLLSKLSQPVTVTGTEDYTIKISDDAKTTTAVEVPPGSTSGAAAISVTTYSEPAVTPPAPGATQQVTPALETVYFEPSGTVFKQPVLFSVSNPVETEIYFENLSLTYKESGGSAWVPQSTPVRFNPETNRYETELTHFSSYSVTMKAEKVISSENVSESNIELKKDNSGNMEAIRDFKIEFSETAGWNFSENLDISIKNALSGISGSSLAGLVKMMQDCITSLEGGKPGIYKISHTLTTNISGNSIMNYNNKAKFCNIQYKFKVNYKKSSQTITVKVKRYTGMKETYTNKDANQHSGGGGK